MFKKKSDHNKIWATQKNLGALPHGNGTVWPYIIYG